MTARLPTVGSDDGTWGSVLNTYLSVSVNSDGTLLSTAITSSLGYTPENPSHKGAASGYAPLDTNSWVPIANLPTGTTSSTVVIGNDSRVTGAIRSGASAGGDLSGTYPNPTVAKVGGVAAVGTSTTQTLSNKRNTRRVVTVTQSATPTINTDNTDVASITGLAQAITSMTTNLSGTPNDGDLLLIRVTDNGTARAINWGSSFEASTIPLPATTTISTMLTVGFEWNPATTKWRCVGIA
jgi:hypothetical protein